MRGNCRQNKEKYQEFHNERGAERAALVDGERLFLSRFSPK